MRGSALSSPMGVPLDLYSDIERKGKTPFRSPSPSSDVLLRYSVHSILFLKMGFQRDSIPLAGFGAAPHNNSIGDTIILRQFCGIPYRTAYRLRGPSKMSFSAMHHP